MTKFKNCMKYFTPQNSTNFTLIFPILFSFYFMTGLTISVSVTCRKPISHASLCNHTSVLSLSTFSKLLIAYTINHFIFADFFVRKTCKSFSYMSGRSLLHDQTSIIGCIEGHTQDTPYTASNTIILFHNPIMLSPSSASSVPWMQLLNPYPIIFGQFCHHFSPSPKWAVRNGKMSKSIVHTSLHLCKEKSCTYNPQNGYSTHG